MRWSLHPICIFFCLAIHAQNETANFRSFTAKEGLSNNFVTCLIQDSRQFLWIGTREGLTRFDGQRFKKYFYQRNNSNSLSGNYIFAIMEYKPGQLLLSTNNGLSVLNTLTGEFENRKIDFAPIQAGSGTAIFSTFRFPDGQIWVSHSGQIDVLDSNLKYKSRFTDIPWATPLKGTIIVKNWYIDKRQRLWFASDTSGIQIVDFSAKRVTNYLNNPEKLPFISKKHYVRSFLLDEKNNILWYTPWGQGLIRHDLTTHKEQQQLFGSIAGMEESTVNSIIQKNERYLLCGTGEGVFEVHIDSLSYRHLVDKRTGIALVHTKDNRFWSGTVEGLIQLQTDSGILKELALPKQRQSLSSEGCSDLANTSTGRIYATYRSNELFEIEKDRVTINVFSVPGRAKIGLTKVCEDKTGQIWVGSSTGIFVFDAITKKFSRPGSVPNELLSFPINVIYCDRSGDVWIGTRAPFALFRYDASQKKAERVTNDIIDHFASLYENTRLSMIIEDLKGNLWMSSQLGGGIVNYNRNTGIWKLYPLSERHKSRIVDKGIISLNADRHNNLWIGDNYGYGLTRYNYMQDSLSPLTRDDGLASDYQENIIADDANNLWLFTEYGITRFNLDNLQSVSYNLPNRPPVRYVSGESLFDPVTNSLVYALNDHLLFVEINRLRKDTNQVVPFIDKITINSKEVFMDAAVQKPWLKHDENNISIEFTGIDFSQERNTHFAYQLSGLDTGWRFSDDSHSAQYANLSPGDYTFRIKTADKNGDWGRGYSVFSFTIMPVFWQTTWFRLAVLALIGFLIYWFVRRRIQTIRREAGLKHKLAETEMLALRSQMNPHFIFNCLNSIDNLIQTNQADKATTYLARFAKLIRSVLESSKSNVVPFYKDFEALQLFMELEQFRCNNKFTYEISADQELLNGDYKVPPLVIQPFVENAIHHGLLNKESGDRKLIVKATLENNYIKYSVQDNGVGRTRAYALKDLNRPEHQSYGIQITSERVHLHNQNGSTDDVVITDLLAEDGPGGTMVKVKLAIR